MEGMPADFTLEPAGMGIAPSRIGFVPIPISRSKQYHFVLLAECSGGAARKTLPPKGDSLARHAPHASDQAVGGLASKALFFEVHASSLFRASARFFVI